MAIFGSLRKDADSVDEIETREKKIDKEFEKEAKKDKFLKKFKLGSHHIIERQLLLLGVTATLAVIGLGISGHGQIVKSRDTLSNKAIYTQSAIFSKNSKVKLVTEKVALSKDGKNAFLLLKGDPESFSQNSRNYTAFVSAWRERMKKIPVGEVYVFGTTGYMGVKMYNADGFSNQVLDVTIRAHKDVAADVAENNNITIKNGYGESFKKFNQIRIYANFGASKATTVDLTNKSDGVEMYRELVANAADKELIKEYKDEVKNLKRLQTRALELEESIESNGYKAPERPEILRDLTFTKSGELKMSSVVGGGYNIEPGSTLDKGYLDQFIVGDVDESSISNMLLIKSAEGTGRPITKREVQDDGSSKEVEVKTSPEKVRGLMNYTGDINAMGVKSLVSKNGGDDLVVFNVSSDTNSAKEMAAASDADSLSEVYRSMYSSIVKIQGNINERRVRLDETVRAQDTLYSHAGGKDHFQTWQQVE